MDKYTIDETQYKNGYQKGYEDGKRNGVITCKECNHWKDIDGKTTENEKVCDIMFCKMKEDGFCSFGEKSEQA
jgi:hypothetical protein